MASKHLAGHLKCCLRDRRISPASVRLSTSMADSCALISFTGAVASGCQDVADCAAAARQRHLENTLLEHGVPLPDDMKANIPAFACNPAQEAKMTRTACGRDRAAATANGAACRPAAAPLSQIG
jgi:hypothetical protein